MRAGEGIHEEDIERIARRVYELLKKDMDAHHRCGLTVESVFAHRIIKGLGEEYERRRKRERIRLGFRNVAGS